MPVTGSNSGPEKGPGGGGRTTFRPPWVKEGPQSSSTTAAPWTKRNEGTSKENGQPAVKESKLQSREIKVPIMTTKPKPVQAPLKPKEEKPEKIEKEQVLETKKDFTLEKPKLRHVDTNNKEKKVAQTELLETPKLRPVLKKTTKVDEVKQPIERKLSSADKTAPKNSDNASSVPAPPPPPPPTNIPRAPPPPPGLKPPEDFEKTPLSDKQKDNLDKLKQRARRRPDWSEMMKEVEDGRKLRHVKCNDRSNPILTSKSLAKVSGQFVYETEKANIHNQLLHQIQSGICLKPTRCNDRSKPILEGLRKFRRQMTIEEQIQKSESRAVLNEVEDPEEESEDEMDDIDKLRDDLQSTKQMLALEMRNKEAQERENKRLLSKIANLEAELKREKTKAPSGNSTTETISTGDEALVTSLKKDAEEARKTCKDLEKKYQQSAEQLDTAKSDIEEQKRQIATLEKRLSQAAQGGGVVDARRPSEPGQKESSPEPELEESESDSDDDDEKKAERLERRLGREVKMLVNKLQKLKDKQQAAQKERTNLKEAMKKNQLLLKEENKKFKKLQKEVDKMAAMMKDDEDDDEEKEDDEEEEEEEDEESETEEETETEDSEDESGSETESESEEEDASNEDKKSNLEPRVKRHEGRLTALKKGNYLLQANVERIQDEINKIREKSVTLQRDLDSVLSELG